ncbi:MAG: SLBB domain-containing protein [Spirochaetes bacterium]|nr:SLBB domain-containing protein [Spirochaetota bacterium]
MVLAREVFIQKVRQAGIVGAGGAGFPTYFKLKNKAEYFIVNISECEPLLQVDQQLSCSFALQIIQTLHIVQEAIKAKHVIIALKKKYEKVKTEFTKVLKDEKSSIQMFLLEDFYPSGDEHDLVYAVTGRIVPEGGLPLDVGVIVDNVGTIINIYNALFHDEPVINRWLTVAGEVEKPQTLNIPLGTPLSKVLEFCGGTTITDYSVIEGGPMMGILITDPENYTIKKTTTALLVLPSDHGLIRRKKESIEESINHSRMACEQCSLCTEYCSRYILGHRDLKPHLMMRKISYLNDHNLEHYVDAYLCSECGLCSLFSCPLLLSPADIYAFLKDALIKNNIPNPYNKKKVDISGTIDQYKYRRVPLKKLKYKIGFTEYDRPAELTISSIDVQMVRIRLKQHIGEKAFARVNKNDKVKKGDLIADVHEESLGVGIHASIDGTVAQVTDEYIEIKSD